MEGPTNQTQQMTERVSPAQSRRGMISSYRCSVCRRWVSQEALDRHYGKCYCGATHTVQGKWYGGDSTPNYKLVEWSALSNAQRAIVRRDLLFQGNVEGFRYEFLEGELVYWLRETPIFSLLSSEPAQRDVHPVARFGKGKAIHRVVMVNGKFMAACGAGRNGKLVHASGAETCKRCLAKLAHAS